jgi:enoyl-[acyl-carrier protein] reductase III
MPRPDEPGAGGEEMTQAAGWSLILGASSGFGAATAIELARSGHDIFGVHLDRRATLAQAEHVQEQVRSLGREAVFFNVNASDAAKRQEVVEAIAARLADQPRKLRVVLHSLAFGSLRPFCPEDSTPAATQSQLEMTLDVMANSLVYWVQDLVSAGVLADGGRVFAMTSEGSTNVWPAYGPVSAAKAALESHCRQLAVELARRGITVNALRAGVTDTPALRKIPGHEAMIEQARRRNPSGRLTTPEDVARCIVALAGPETAWLTGNTLGVDGGEHVAG